MRKVVLLVALLSLVIVPCAAFGLNTNPFSEFGLRRNYTAHGSVNIFSGQDPYYGDVTEYVSSPYDAFFAGKISGDQIAIRLPLGTLVRAEDGEFSGTHYQFHSRYWGEKGSFDHGEIVEYASVVFNYQFEGKKFIYNIATSPDVIVGSFTVPMSNDKISKSISVGDVVPFVKIVSEDVVETYGEETHTRHYLKQIEISFVEYGNWNNTVNSPNVTNKPVH